MAEKCGWAAGEARRAGARVRARLRRGVVVATAALLVAPLVQVAGLGGSAGLLSEAHAEEATIASTNPLKYKELRVQPGKVGRSELESGDLSTVAEIRELPNAITFNGRWWYPSHNNFVGGVEKTREGERHQVSVRAPEIGFISTFYEDAVLSGEDLIYKFNPQKFLDAQSKVHELTYSIGFMDGSVQKNVVLPLRLVGLDGRLANDLGGDFDGDGVTNGEEARSGANPFDARDKGKAKKPLPKLPQTTTPAPAPSPAPSSAPAPAPTVSSEQPKPPAVPTSTTVKPTVSYKADKYDPYPGELLIRLKPGEEYRTGKPFGGTAVSGSTIRYTGKPGAAVENAFIDVSDANRFVVKAKGLDTFAEAYDRDFGNSKPEFEKVAKWFQDTFITSQPVEVDYDDNSTDVVEFFIGIVGMDGRAFAIASADFDEDGVSNSDELRFGTNPFSPGSKPYEKPKFSVTSKSVKPGEVYEFVPSEPLDPNTKLVFEGDYQVSLTPDGNVRVVGSSDKRNHKFEITVKDPLYGDVATLHVESDFTEDWTPINVQAGSSLETNVMTNEDVADGVTIASVEDAVPEWMKIGPDGEVFLNPPRSESATKGTRTYWVTLSTGKRRVIRVNVLDPTPYAEEYKLQYPDVFVRLGESARSHIPLATVAQGTAEFYNQPVPEDAQVSFAIHEGENASVVEQAGTAKDGEQPGMVTFSATGDNLKAGDVVRVMVKASFGADNSTQYVPVYFNILDRKIAGRYNHTYETGREVLPGTPIVLHRTDVGNVPEGTDFLFFEDKKKNQNLAGWNVTVNRGTGNLVVRAPQNGARPLDAVVTVSYPDGSSTDVPFHVGVKHSTPDVDEYEPKYVPETLIGGSRTSYEMLTPVPPNTTFSIEENAGVDVSVDTKTGRITAVLPKDAPGGATYNVRVRVKYPDGSDEIITAELRKKATADDERPRWSDIYVMVGELASTPQGQKLPPETTFGVDASFAPKGWQVHVDKYSGTLQVLPDASVQPKSRIEVPVVVTFKDGSQRTVKVPAVVRAPRHTPAPPTTEAPTSTPAPTTNTPAPKPAPAPTPETRTSAAGWAIVILGSLGFLVGGALLALQEFPVIQSNVNKFMRDLGLRR